MNSLAGGRFLTVLHRKPLDLGNHQGVRWHLPEPTLVTAHAEAYSMLVGGRRLGDRSGDARWQSGLHFHNATVSEQLGHCQ